MPSFDNSPFWIILLDEYRVNHFASKKFSQHFLDTVSMFLSFNPCRTCGPTVVSHGIFFFEGIFKFPKLGFKWVQLVFQHKFNRAFVEL